MLIHFYVDIEDRDLLEQKLKDLGEDFSYIETREYTFQDPGNNICPWVCVSGKIEPHAATMLKLQDSFLAKHMTVSRISEELKDKYRT